MAEERLQKLIARAGTCSRRDAEALISEGRVKVNGVVAGLGAKADPEVDSIKVDGVRLKAPEPLRYVLLYKPREVMTTCDDPEKRETVLDLLKSLVPERVFPVGRLDYHSEGLLLLTNDGELAARVTHPRYGLLREYLVKVRGEIDERDIARIMKGTVIDGHHVKPVDVVRAGSTRSGSNTWWRVRVAEGRTHEVRELFFRAGHHVQRLRRSAIGPLRDDSLRPGEFRDLTAAEVRSLRSATSTKSSKGREVAPSIGRSGRRDGNEPAGGGTERRTPRGPAAAPTSRSAAGRPGKPRAAAEGVAPISRSAGGGPGKPRASASGAAPSSRSNSGRPGKPRTAAEGVAPISRSAGGGPGKPRASAPGAAPSTRSNSGRPGKPRTAAEGVAPISRSAGGGPGKPRASAPGAAPSSRSAAGRPGKPRPSGDARRPQRKAGPPATKAPAGGRQRADGGKGPARSGTRTTAGSKGRPGAGGSRGGKRK